MNKLKVLLGSVCMCSMVAFAAVEDNDVVPTTISMTEYCGIISVDPVDFSNIATNADAVSEGTVAFDITW